MTQRSFQTDQFLQGRAACIYGAASKRLNTEAFTQRSLLRDAFTHRSFYTKKLSHGEAVTQSSFHTRTSLRREGFTLRRLYTQKLLDREAFAHRAALTRSKATVLPQLRKGRVGHFQITISLHFFGARLSFRAQGLRRTLQIAIWPLFLTFGARHDCAAGKEISIFKEWASAQVPPTPPSLGHNAGQNSQTAQCNPMLKEHLSHTSSC